MRGCFRLSLGIFLSFRGASGSRRISSSYCTNNACPLSSLRAASDAFNQVSITSFYLNGSAPYIFPCTSSNGACSWNGSVEAFNEGVSAATSGAVQAVPLVFMNSGSTVENFRAVVNSKGGTAAAAETLAEIVVGRRYAGVSLDLEPSCWASDPRECVFPTREDAGHFKTFINDLSSALRRRTREHSDDRHRSAGRTATSSTPPPLPFLSVAAGGFPATQCDGGFPEYEEFCGEQYAAQCEAGALNVSTCNCCAFTTWFELGSLCSSQADRIVNMDTYQPSPLNISLFDAAMEYYVAYGCAMEPPKAKNSFSPSSSSLRSPPSQRRPEWPHSSDDQGTAPSRLAIGLLVGEGGDNETSVSELFDAVDRWASGEKSGVVVEELDVWVNMWDATNAAILELWRSHLDEWLTGAPGLRGDGGEDRTGDQRQRQRQRRRQQQQQRRRREKASVGGFDDGTTMNASVALAAAPEGNFSTVSFEPSWPLPAQDPALVPAGHVWVTVTASSVNPVDWKLITSHHDIRYPKVLGFDMAGTLVGDGCAPRLRGGDRVWADLGDHDLALRENLELGAYANVVLAKCAQIGLAPMSIALEEAAVLPLVGLTAFQAFRMVGAPWTGTNASATSVSGDSSSKVESPPCLPHVQDMVVVVTSGSGGTGHVALQMAKFVYGVGSLVTACGPTNVDFCEAMGADTVVDYTQTDVLETLDDDSVDIVFDNYGAPGTADRALPKIRSGGFFIFLPGKGGQLSNSTKEGVTQVNYGLTDSSNHTTSGLDDLRAMVESGAVKGHVQESFPLERVADAFAVSFSGSVTGKLGIQVAP